MDFSVRLDDLQQRADDAKTSARVAVTESRDQLRERIDQARVDVDLAATDARAAGRRGRRRRAEQAGANASYRQQRDNPGVTESVELKGRGRALTVDSGWREVADTAMAFIERLTSLEPRRCIVIDRPSSREVAAPGSTWRCP